MTTLGELVWTFALFPVTVYTLLVISIASTSLKSTRWNYSFQWLGVYELQRRNFGAMDKTARHAVVLETVIGLSDVPDDGDVIDDPSFHLMAALTGESNTDGRVGTEICRRRRELLFRCLMRQQYVAKRVVQVQRLPLPWVICEFVSLCEVCAQGFVRIVPAAIHYLGKRLSVPFVISQVAAVLLGGTCWTLFGSSGTDPLTTISYFTTAGALIAAWLSIVNLCMELARQRWGDPRAWELRWVCLAAALFIFEYATITAIRNDVPARIAELQAAVFDELQNSVVPQLNGNPKWSVTIGAVVVLGLFGWRIRNFISNARSSFYALSERIAYASLSLLFLLICAITLASITMDFPTSTFLTFLTVGMVVVILLLLLARIVALHEWNLRRTRVGSFR
ncbi:hypothetical protein ACRAJ3_01730 [Rhodococcus pyridinivorans]|uniref:hypothetical protein n=1 Tax=Rhodococcus pyridinivorans TaxID=103816 RepID=UPI003D7F562C